MSTSLDNIGIEVRAVRQVQEEAVLVRREWLAVLEALPEGFVYCNLQEESTVYNNRISPRIVELLLAGQSALPSGRAYQCYMDHTWLNLERYQQEHK